MIRSWKERLADESGATMMFVAVSMVVLLGAAALAVDVGMLLESRSQAQRTADAAVLAGASVYMPPSVPPAQTVDSARARALRYVALNPVRGQPVNPADVTLTIRPESLLVRAELRRRDIPTWFAQIFGVNTADVTGRAAAEAAASGTAECLKPIMVPDWWVDANNDKRFNTGEYYDPNVTGWGTDYRNPGMPGYAYVIKPPDYYRDWGRPDTLKPGSSNQNMTPSWYFPFRFPGLSGANEYRDGLSSACAISTLAINDWVDSEPGNMIGPTKQGIQNAIAADPNAQWVNGVGIVNSLYGSGERSPRVATFPLFAPNQQIPNGTSTPVQINNFGSFFIQAIDNNNNVIGRWIRVRAVPDRCRERGNCRASLQYLRLIE